ncbi:hypothetical protein J6590_072874 [Homalodisca vitripennis]|nr:hypothetical protein J6590_072874 [Homalodisca vitripennis]
MDPKSVRMVQTRPELLVQPQKSGLPVPPPLTDHPTAKDTNPVELLKNALCWHLNAHMEPVSIESKNVMAKKTALMAQMKYVPNRPQVVLKEHFNAQMENVSTNTQYVMV